MLLFLGRGERGREKEREREMSQIRELVVWCKEAT